jgi:acylphosphatase
VQVLFEGEKNDVERAIDFWKRGPPGAHVRDLDVEWQDWKSEFRDFRIAH